MPLREEMCCFFKNCVWFLQSHHALILRITHFHHFQAQYRKLENIWHHSYVFKDEYKYCNLKEHAKCLTHIRHLDKIKLSHNKYFDFYSLPAAQLFTAGFVSDPHADKINLLQLLEHEMPRWFSWCFLFCKIYSVFHHLLSALCDKSFQYSLCVILHAV